MVYDVCLSLLSKKNKALKNQLNDPCYVLRDSLPCLGWCLVTYGLSFWVASNCVVNGEVIL